MDHFRNRFWPRELAKRHPALVARIPDLTALTKKCESSFTVFLAPGANAHLGATRKRWPRRPVSGTVAWATLPERHAPKAEAFQVRKPPLAAAEPETASSVRVAALVEPPKPPVPASWPGLVRPPKPGRPRPKRSIEARAPATIAETDALGPYRRAPLDRVPRGSGSQPSGYTPGPKRVARGEAARLRCGP